MKNQTNISKAMQSGGILIGHTIDHTFQARLEWPGITKVCSEPHLSLVDALIELDEILKDPAVLPVII